MATDKDPVCESCLDAVREAAMSVGESYDDEEHVNMLARTSGGDIFDHSCEADDDEEVECNCGCQRN